MAFKLKFVVLIALLKCYAHGLEVADIDKASLEYLKMVKLENIDYDKTKLDKFGNMDYVTFQAEIPIEVGVPVV